MNWNVLCILVGAGFLLAGVLPMLWDFNYTGRIVYTEAIGSKTIIVEDIDQEHRDGRYILNIELNNPNEEDLEVELSNGFERKSLIVESGKEQEFIINFKRKAEVLDLASNGYSEKIYLNGSILNSSYIPYSFILIGAGFSIIGIKGIVSKKRFRETGRFDGRMLKLDLKQGR
jgi:hypothetical protein